MNDIEQQRAHFNRIALRYFQARQDPRHLYLKDRMWRSFFASIRLPGNDVLNILEAMCGYAESLSISAKCIDKKFAFSAFDYSDAMIEYVRMRHDDVHVWIQDVTTFRSPGTYDIIYIIGGLHHVHKHARKVFENVAASLTPGGLFISFEPTHNNFLFSAIRKCVYAKNSFFDQETERGFSTKELDDLGREWELQPCGRLYPGLLAYVLWYNPDAFPALNRGSLSFAKKIIDLESRLWRTPVARILSFATLTCYKKQ